MVRLVHATPGVLKVGYVLKRFPRLSETFILNEILELERQDVHVEIFSLMRPPEEPMHELLKSLRAEVTYLPGTSALDGIIIRRSERGAGLKKQKLSDSFNLGPAPFSRITAGKSGEEAAVLGQRALAVAMLAGANGIDHLHAHFGSDATTVALLASRLSKFPFSYTAHARDIYHTYVDPKIDAGVRRAKIEEAEFVVTVSDYNRRHLVELAGPAAAPRIHRLYNGIDLQRFTATKALRDDGLILAVGRLVEKKGFKDLVDACKILSDRNTDFRCKVVGAGPLHDELEAQIKRLGLSGIVELMGPRPQEQLLEIMRSAAMIVLPCVVSSSGDRDGLPTVLLEALALNIPAISTSVAGIPEIIEHEKSGLLVAPNNPEELALSMGRLLGSATLRSEIAAAGRQKAEREFDLVTNVAKLRRHFERSANTGPASLRVSENENRVRFS